MNFAVHHHGLVVVVVEVVVVVVGVGGCSYIEIYSV